MADLTRIEALTLKKLLGEITSDEDIELQALAETSEENREFVDRMNPEAFKEELRALSEINFDRLDRLMKKKIGHIPGVLEWVSEKTWLQRAARPAGITAVFLLVVAGAARWYYDKTRNIETALRYPIEATLSWPGRTTIDLGTIPEEKGYKIGDIYIARIGNQIYINRRVDTVTADADAIRYQVNNISGLEDIQLFIQDSARTQVYPGSGLSFQIYQPGTPLKQKEMTCYGRVLFDVNHNFETPWVVKTPKQEVSVLGTAFEVRDYNNQNTSAVLCYSGRVLVKDPGSTPQILNASQRLTIDSMHTLKVSTGGFPKSPQWSSKELLFDFSDMNLDSAMTEIAHWYGLSKVKFDAAVDRKKTGDVFSGKLSRYLTLQRLLSILERKDLHFNIQGQTLLVTK